MKIFSLSNFKINLNPKNNQEENYKLPASFYTLQEDSFKKSPKSAEKLGFSGASAVKTAKLPVAELEKLFADFLQKLSNEPDAGKKNKIYNDLIDKNKEIKQFVNDNVDSFGLKDATDEDKQLFRESLNHEALNYFISLRYYLAVTQRKISPKPLVENFHQICKNTFNDITELYKKYQFFIDSEIYRSDKFFPLNDLLKYSLDLVKGKTNSLSVEGAELLENTKLDIENMDIYSVFSNIIQNAAKYSKNKGDIKITFEKGKCPEGRDVLNFSVEDNGIGIPKDQFDSIQNSYRGTNTGEIEGTGFGLRQVRKILENKYSKIIIESEEGKGTKITCPLPILSAPER